MYLFLTITVDLGNHFTSKNPQSRKLKKSVNFLAATFTLLISNDKFDLCPFKPFPLSPSSEKRRVQFTLTDFDI